MSMIPMRSRSTRYVMAQGSGLRTFCLRLRVRLRFELSGMRWSRAWCGTPPFLGAVNMVGTRTFTCYMGAQ